MVEQQYNIVFKLTSPSWTVTHYAGYGGLPGTGGDGGLATDALLWNPWGIDVDGAGDVYISDSGNGTIRVVDATTGIIDRVAGTTGVWGLAGDGGPALSAELNFPTDTTVDGYGNVYIADRLNHRVRRVFGIATPNFPPPPGENAPPEWQNWHFGDVHAHAAGDDNLLIHPQCEARDFTEAECADFLVDDSLERAAVFGTDFIVFTEHGPWLGYQKEGFPEFYDATQAETEWNLIKAELDEQSTTDIRGLIGEELGTAAPACTAVSPPELPLPSAVRAISASTTHPSMWTTACSTAARLAPTASRTTRRHSAGVASIIPTTMTADVGVACPCCLDGSVRRVPWEAWAWVWPRGAGRFAPAAASSWPPRG